ncbi:MAG: PKD domain-containing protein [bacterium]
MRGWNCRSAARRDGAPTAMLTAAQTSGLFQLSVNLDARKRFDQFGRIVSYEFNPGDGSGWRDDPGNDGWFPWTYLTGEYDAQVRVTDDEGLSDTASLHISVS